MLSSTKLDEKGHCMHRLYTYRLFAPQFPCSATFPTTQAKEIFRGFLWSGNNRSKFSLFWQTSFQGSGQTQDGLI